MLRHAIEVPCGDLGQVSDDKTIWLDRRDSPDQLIEPGENVSLKGGGVERFYTKSRVWKLDVQGTVIESEGRHIQVQSALEKAGIDLTKKWTIVLKVAGQPKQVVELGTVIDLGTPGIERLRLIPDKINNGDGRAMRRQFDLLPRDVAYLNKRHPGWEAVIDKECRWLLLSEYQLPVGFTAASTELAILIPGPYPAAEVDMFYCYPPLALASRVPIPQTESHVDIGGRKFQRWSRHRDGGVWSPSHDSILTHMGLIEESLNREVGL